MFIWIEKAEVSPLPLFGRKTIDKAYWRRNFPSRTYPSSSKDYPCPIFDHSSCLAGEQNSEDPWAKKRSKSRKKKKEKKKRSSENIPVWGEHSSHLKWVPCWGFTHNKISREHCLGTQMWDGSTSLKAKQSPSGRFDNFPSQLLQGSQSKLTWKLKPKGTSEFNSWFCLKCVGWQRYF